MTDQFHDHGDDEVNSILPLPELGEHSTDEERENAVNAYREAGLHFIAFLDQVLAFVVSHENPRLAALVVAMATGRDSITGGISQSQLGERFGLTKACVCQAVKKCQGQLGSGISGIGPMPSQRTISQCAHFSEKRKKQLQ